jgi:uncharacterized LabA/DUF88 family protein
MEDRYAIFIDGSNLYHALKSDFGKVSLSLQKLRDKLVAGRKHIRTYYYNTAGRTDEPTKYAAHQRFLESLKNIPYFQITLGRLEPRDLTFVEKGVDVTLAVDLLLLAHQNAYDVAIVVSGDADFSYAVHAVKQMGKRVIVAFCRSSLAKQLRQECDECIDLNETFLAECWLQS